MILVFKRWAAVLLVLSVSIAAADQKDHSKLEVAPAASYPFKQTSDGVTIAADVYETGDKVKAAFGKHNPYDYGVLPVLVVIQNDGPKAIHVDHLKVDYVMPGHGRIEATPARDLAYIHGARPPGLNPAPIPGLPGISRSHKNPLAEWEIDARAFAANIILPHDSASGFFYFQTGHRSNSTLYISGIDQVGGGTQLVYFEIPLAPVQ